MKRKKALSSSLLAILLAMTLCLGGCGNGDSPTTSGSGKPVDPGEIIEITFSHMFPVVHPVHLRYEEWAKALSKETNGRVKITFHYAQTLLTAAETYEGVVNGVADMGQIVPAYTPGLFPMLELFDLPVDYNNCEVISKVLWQCIEEFKPEEYSAVKVLSAYAIGPGAIATKKAVHNLEDLKGLQIRAAGLASNYIPALGAAPVSVAMPESYDALSRGTCDGVLNAWDAFITWKLVEVADCFTMTSFMYTSPFINIMNLEKWNSLPADIQAAFEKVSEDFIGFHATAEAKNAITSIQAIIDSGKEIIVLSDEEEARWMERMKPAIASAIAERAAKGPAQAFYDRMVELAKQYNADSPSLKEVYLDMIS